MNEDFGYLKDEEQSRASVIVKKCLLAGTVLFSILCFIYISMNAYYFVYSDNNNEIKTIKSPEEPIKVVEGAIQTEDGITVISDLDKNVYENIVGNKKESLEKTRTGLKIPERPVNPAVNPSNRTKKEMLINKDNNKSVQLTKNNEKVIIYDAASKANINESQAKSKLSKKETDAKIENNSEKKVEAKLTTSENIRNQNQATIKTKSPKQASRVQLAAMNSAKSASDYWEKLDEKHSKLFSGLKPVIQEVNLGQRGMFYRLQIDGFYSQIEAEEFCLKFINQTGKTKSDCIVVE